MRDYEQAAANKRNHKTHNDTLNPDICNSNTQSICLRTRCFFVALAFGLLLVPQVVSAQWIEETEISRPLVENEPFDLIYLKAEGDAAGKVIKVIPLLEPPPNPLPRQGELIFEYFAESEGLLVVKFQDVAAYKTFQQMLLDEADGWLEQKDFARAFRNLLYVYDRGGRSDVKVVKALRNCLFLDGKETLESGNFELALSIYEDIYEQDPNFRAPGVDGTVLDIVMRCYDEIIGRQFNAEDYGTVQKTLEGVQARYPEDFEAIGKRWEQRFTDKADQLIAQSKKFATQSKGRQAHLAARQAEQMDPGRPEVLALKEAILEQFPLIVVAVSQPASDADPRRFEHWGARRVGRLTQRRIVELTGVTDEGGKYAFLNGELTRDDQEGYRYIFTIDPIRSEFGAPPTTAFEVASRLLDLADPESDIYSEAWAKIGPRIAIENERQVSLQLRRAFVRPEALVDCIYRLRSEDGKPVQNGTYLLTDQEEGFSTYELNSRIERIAEAQHPVVIEQLFEDASESVTQLLKGNVDVVDRVPISDLARLRRKPGIQTRAYMIPTVHMLVPKVRGELEKNTSFRRGLSHVIDRDVILKTVICGGREVSGCEVISGPLPIGTEENDQVSYGYNFKVRPVAFSRKLGMVLIQMALLPPGGSQKPEVGKEGEFKKSIKPPSLVLAHPTSATATNACFAIAERWSRAGVPTSTRALKPGEAWPSDELWDFLYLEASMEEPLADVARVLGATGFAKDVSAPVEQTLNDLGYTQTWQSACSNLRLLHQQIAVDQAVIPLWQIKEYYGYRTNVRGIGRELIHLYQYIQRWRIDINPEEETE